MIAVAVGPPQRQAAAATAGAVGPPQRQAHGGQAAAATAGGNIANRKWLTNADKVMVLAALKNGTTSSVADTWDISTRTVQRIIKNCLCAVQAVGAQLA